VPPRRQPRGRSPWRDLDSHGDDAVHRFDPFAAWLVLAYVLFVFGLLLGNFVNGAWAGRVTAAADETDPALELAVRDARGPMGIALFWLIIAAIVFLMVAKPSS
jgi:hypothetical protein